MRGASLWLVVLATVAVQPGAFSRWVLVKVLVVAIAAVLAALSEAAAALPRWVQAAVGALLAWAVGATLLSDAPLHQLLGRWPRYEGVVTVSAYLLALWIGARALGPSPDASTRRTLGNAASAAAVALGGIALAEAAGARPFSTSAARPGSLTGSATDQGILAVALGAVVLYLLMNESVRRATRRWWWAGLAGSASALALSGSRAAWLAAVVAAALGWAVAARRRGVRNAVALLATAPVVIGAAAIAVIALVFPAPRSRVVGGLADASIGLSDRPVVWSDALHTIASTPWWGGGLNGFAGRVELHHSARWFADVGPTTTLDSPHNIVLQVAAVGGWIAVAGAVALAGTVAMVWWRRASAGNDIAGLALAVGAASGVALLASVTSPAVLVLPALLGGAAMSTAAPGAGRARQAAADAKQKGRPSRAPVAAVAVQRSGRERTMRAVLVFALAAWALALVPTVAAEWPLGRAVAAADRDDVAGALDGFEAARGLRPWDVDIDALAAQSLAAAADRGAVGAPDAAIAAADRVDAAGASTVSVDKARAVALIAGGDLDAATSTLELLAQERPLDSWVAHRLGAALLLSGHREQAIAELEHALVLDPGNADIAATLDYARSQ